MKPQSDEIHLGQKNKKPFVIKLYQAYPIHIAVFEERQHSIRVPL